MHSVIISFWHLLIYLCFSEVNSHSTFCFVTKYMQQDLAEFFFLNERGFLDIVPFSTPFSNDFCLGICSPYSYLLGGFYPTQFSSVTQSCPTLCDPMNRSMPGLPVHHQLPESTQTHVHWVGDAIQPSHPLPSPSPPALNLSQHQALFQWVNSSHQVAKVLQFQL